MADIKKIKVQIGSDTKDLEKGVKKAEGSLNKFSSTIKKIGGLIAGAFAVDRIIRFGAEALSLGAKMEGVKTAFEKLNNPNLLNDLQEATRGTVDNLTLMQSAVRAQNFKIPLQNLATYFQFATNRAIETGESVDYLVNSIIDGIGRKSSLVLDNLGISAAELQDEIKKVGDFGLAAGNIIERSMKSAGEVTSTAATEIQRSLTTWENFKTELGTSLATALGNFIKTMEDAENAVAIMEGRAKVAEKPVREFGKSLLDVDTKFKASQLNNVGLWGVSQMIGDMAREAREAIPALLEVKDAVEEGPFDFSLPAEKTNNHSGHTPRQHREQKEYFDMILDKFHGVNQEAEKLGGNIGVMLVNSFASLGDAIGQALSGAQGALESLGQAIMQNLGNILIMAGMQSGNVPLIIAGAALQLGTGIWRGLMGGGNATTEHTTGRSAVYFQMSGNNLAGTVTRYNEFKHTVT